MTPTVEAGLEHQRAGRLEQAETTYRVVLAEDPGNADAFHLLGVLAHQVGKNGVAVGLVGRAVQLKPNTAEYFNTLGALLRTVGERALAMGALEVALELDVTHAKATQQLATLRADGAPQPGQRINLDEPRPALRFGTGDRFAQFALQPSSEVLIGVSVDGSRLVKIGLCTNPRKLHSPLGEAAVMRALNDRGCVSCPTVREAGTIARATLIAALDTYQSIAVSAHGLEQFEYIVMDFAPARGAARIADVLLAVLEQKSLGYYHGDLKPENIRFDDRTGACYLIDYDQAERLSDEVLALDNQAFLNWCDARARERYGFSTMWFYFVGAGNTLDLTAYFRNGLFDLGTTALFSEQQTTMSAGNIYHSFELGGLFADGERDLTERTAVLDRIEFAPGEPVLDIGCNAGLLSLYLYRRGCAVVGVDLDARVVRGAQMVANIIGAQVRYARLDVDADTLPHGQHTVMLFSVLHHTQNVAENAHNIAASCQRIIIECRLQEIGAKPVNGVWQNTSNWDFESLEDMVSGLEQLFPRFKLKANHGRVDRDRYILEFARAS